MRVTLDTVKKECSLMVVISMVELCTELYNPGANALRALLCGKV